MHVLHRNVCTGTHTFCLHVVKTVALPVPSFRIYIYICTLFMFIIVIIIFLLFGTGRLAGRRIVKHPFHPLTPSSSSSSSSSSIQLATISGIVYLVLHPTSCKFYLSCRQPKFSKWICSLMGSLAPVTSH